MDCDAVTAGDVELCDDPEYVATVTAAVDAWRAELDVRMMEMEASDGNP
jgi:hypothetical protein